MSQRHRLCLPAAAVLILFSLVACGGEGVPSTGETAEVAPTSTSVPAAATPAEASEATPAASPSPVHRGRFGPVVFSSDFDDTAEQPVDVGLAFDQGIVRLYAYWPYEDAQPGERFRWDFFQDGNHFYGEYGTFKFESGSQWQWIVKTDGEPLDPGTYELVVKVGDEVVLQDACEIREAPTPTPTQVPTPTETTAPAPTSIPTTRPQPTPTPSPTWEAKVAVGWVEVLNYCGSDMTFTIAGQMYTVGANSSQRIELFPGEYPYTASLGLGRYGDINGIVTVQAGVISQLPFSAEV
jgi:hypothetical protein